MKRYLLLLSLVIAGSNSFADSGNAASADKRAGACASEPLYQQFVRYRRALNSARAPHDLSVYFSPSFNAYFQRQLEKAASEEGRNQAMAQYWDNLNSAQDIISVYRREVKCVNEKRVLYLTASLNSDLPRLGESVALWQIQIEYRLTDQAWRINSLEFNRLKHPNHTLPLLDNFSVLPR